MSLKKYVSKRKLKESLEPAARIFHRKKGTLQFVIQKHAASHLHYDFRLEVDGVLKSWAIPKGPSLDPDIKRLAIMVEDHPYSYRNFEGIIPKGYGAGTVMIWDKGVYSVEEKSAKESERLIKEGLKKGALHFSLEGEKLKGQFSLIKLKTERNEWLLIKKQDAFSSKKDIEKQDQSVLTGRTLEQISGKDSALLTAKKNKILPPIKPMLATLIDTPFDDEEWIFEIKWDGFRTLAIVNKKSADIYSRNLLSFNDRFPSLVKDLKDLHINAVLDGEIVILDKKGLSSFQNLQNTSSQDNIYYYVFDLLYLNGRDLRSLPLIKRKSLLKKIIPLESHIRYADHVEREGKRFFEECKKRGCEGIIGKKKESSYLSGYRSKEWVKIKTGMQQEVVICGFTEPRKTRKNFGALIVGVYKKGKLHFAGHVGGGFSKKKLDEVKSLLTPLITQKCPFENTPKTNTPVTWVTPKYLCEVKFREWTSEAIMRQPTFLGIRMDKSSQSVIQEKPKKRSKSNSFNVQKYHFLTHLDKIFWPDERITKKDLLTYYDSIAPFILPYLKNRPESLRRFPDGILGQNFFQKNLKTYPEWISTVAIEHQKKMVNYLVIQDKNSLLYAANLGCIEIHPWLSSYQNIDNPDFLVWDLDPIDIAFDAVIETALQLHDVLEEIKIPNYCKTSGSRGLHIYIPLKAKYSYEQAKRFALLVAHIVHAKLPSLTSLERGVKNRQKRVYIDCFQNDFAQTIVAPYSVRAKPGALVSTPLTWSEVKKGLDPSNYTIFNTLKRIQKNGDLFKPILQKGINMKRAIELLSHLFR